MSTSIGALPKKRGRPATGKDPLLNFRSPPELTYAIDRAMAAAGQSSRSEFIRAVLTEHLQATGYLPKGHT